VCFPACTGEGGRLAAAAAGGTGGHLYGPTGGHP
jgi:hypothetical protein